MTEVLVTDSVHEMVAASEVPTDQDEGEMLALETAAEAGVAPQASPLRTMAAAAMAVVTRRNMVTPK
jgi:hypothetical protein